MGRGVVPDLTDDERASLPSTWIWAKVRDLGYSPDDAVQVGPMSMRSRDFEESGVPVLNVACIQWGSFDEFTLNYLPEAKASAFDRYRVRRNDVLFTRSGTIGRCAVAGKAQDGYLMTFHLLRVRLDPGKCLPAYLELVFQGPHIRRQMEGAAIGSTRAGFNTRLLADLDVPFPPLDEQRAIVERVRTAFHVLDGAHRRTELAKGVAAGLPVRALDRALSGELV